jgi:hypothetical protein
MPLFTVTFDVLSVFSVDVTVPARTMALAPGAAVRAANANFHTFWPTVPTGPCDAMKIRFGRVKFSRAMITGIAVASTPRGERGVDKARASGLVKSRKTSSST